MGSAHRDLCELGAWTLAWGGRLLGVSIPLTGVFWGRWPLHLSCPHLFRGPHDACLPGLGAGAAVSPTRPPWPGAQH